MTVDIKVVYLVRSTPQLFCDHKLSSKQENALPSETLIPIYVMFEIGNHNCRSSVIGRISWNETAGNITSLVLIKVK